MKNMASEILSVTENDEGGEFFDHGLSMPTQQSSKFAWNIYIYIYIYDFPNCRR